MILTIFTSTLQVQKYIKNIHPGRWTAGSPTAITHEKKGKWSEPNLQGIMVHINLPGCMFKFNLPDCLFVLNGFISKQKRPQFLDQKSPFLSLASNDASKPKRLDAPVTYGRWKNISTCSMEKRWCKLGNYLEAKLQNICFFLEVGTWSWNGGCENLALYC